MKTLATSVIVILSLTTAWSQSKSYEAFREKFQGGKDVYAFHTSGFFARSILWMAGEHDFRDALEEVRDVRFVVVPKKLFRDEHVSLKGFMSFARKDGFQDLARIKDRGDDVILMLQAAKKDQNDRYLLIVEDNDEVVVIEIQGYIDPEVLLEKERLAYNQ